MKRYSLVAWLLLGVFLEARTAAAEARKLHPLLRRERAAARAVRRPARAGEPSLKVKVRVRPGTARAALGARHPRARFFSQNGDVVTAEVPVSALDSLASDPAVRSAEPAYRLHPALNVAKSSTTAFGGVVLGALAASSTDFGSNQGQGVVLGFVDSGIDFRHKDFIVEGSPDTTRILSIWDQTDAGGPAPGGFSYGSEWTAAAINDEIDGSPAGVVRQSDTSGHGTHVAGIAAGDGSATDGDEPAGTYVGFAPRADIVMVKTSFFDSDIIDAVNYIVAKAAAAGKRAVINMSLGGHLGSHDGDSPFETAIDAVAASTPIVVSMGNEQGIGVHASAAVAPSGQTTFQAQNFFFTDSFLLDFWIPAGDGYTVTVTTLVSGGGSVSAASGIEVTGSLGPTSVTIYNSTHSDHPAGDKEVLIFVNESPVIGPIDFFVRFQRTANGATGRIDGWSVNFDVTNFATNVDETRTLGEPASADNVISVGAYCARRQWPANNGTEQTDPLCSAAALGGISASSSRGPTRDGRLKPDLSAPGEVVASALSANTSPAPSQNDVLKDGRHIQLQGTSMSAPVVAGLAALRVQRDPGATVSQIRTTLQVQASTDSKTGVVPNNTWGYGKVRAFGCGDLVLSAPGPVSAFTLGTSSIAFSWSSVDKATSYNVYYATSPGSRIANVAGTSFDFTSLLANTTYGVLVAGSNACGDGPTAASPSTSTLSNRLAGASLTVDVASITAVYIPLPSSPRSSSSFGYLLQASTAADFTGTVFSSATSNAALDRLAAAGLDVQTTYFLRLGTLNEPGAAHFVSLSSQVTGSGLVPPGAAPFQGVTVDQIQAHWTTGGNVPGLEYLAQASTASDFSGTLQSSQTFNLFALFTGLSANTTHHFRARAVGGPIGALGSTSTLAAPPAAAAQAFLSVFPSSASVSWSGNGNPLSVTSYTVALTTGGSYPNTFAGNSVLAATAPAGAALQATLGGLLGNSTYQLFVAAVNHNGVPTAFTLAGSSHTLANAPGPPSFSAVQRASMTVSWSSGGNPAQTLYEAEVSSRSDFSPAAVSSATLNLSLDLTGLDGNTTYYARVRAVNHGGQPSAYVQAATSTLTLPPTAAGSSFVSVTSSITVRWTPLAAAPQSAACEGYRVEASTASDFSGQIRANKTSDPLASSLGVVGLTGNTTYYLRVGALNWNEAANYLFLGSTRTVPTLVSSRTVNGFSSTLVRLAPPPFSQLTAIEVEVPLGALPTGTVVTMSASVGAFLPNQDSNQTRLAAFGPNVAVDISAEGHQPSAPAAVRMYYASGQLPSGSSEDQLVVGRYVPEEGLWTLLPSSVDKRARLIAAQTLHFSSFAPFASSAGSGVEFVRIFPVPWQPGSGDPLFDAPELAFTNLPRDGKVRLYTILGESVWEGDSGPDGVLHWNGLNSRGGRVASGTYLAVITGAGLKTVRRVVIIR